FLRDLRRDKRADGRAACPSGGMDPKRAMGRYPIEFHFGFVKGLLDLFGAFEAFLSLDHVIGRLRAVRAGLFGVGEKVRQVFTAMLRPFDTRMKAGLSHRFARRVYRGSRVIAN